MDKSVFERINEFFYRERGFGMVSSFHGNDTHEGRTDCVNCSGGSKALETPLAIGAFNYFNLGGYLNFLRKLPWKRPESVQLILKDQEDDVFTIYGLNSNI